MDGITQHSASQVYSRLIAYFLPAALESDRDASNQARMFLVSHIFGPFLGSTVPLALYIVDPEPGFDILVLALSIWGFWIFPFLLRAGFAYSKLVVFSILNLHFAILWSCFFGGGVTSPTAVWLLIIPILSIFYLGGDRRLIPNILTVSTIAFGTYAVSASQFGIPESNIPASAQLSLGATSILATLCYVMMMAIHYSRIFDASVELENEVRRRQKMATDLRSAVIKANEASSAKSEFLARMSHELRSPLNAIIGYGEILKEEAEESGEEALRVDVERILDAGHYLVRLIDLVLALSRIEAGGMELHPKSVDTRNLIEKSIADRRDMIEAGGNVIACDFSRAPASITVDPHQLNAVFASILENAAEHTRNGTIRVVVSPAVRDGKEAIAVTVSDTGDGIPPDVVPSIFDAFATTQRASGDRYGGTGLSLTVSSRICEEMGGDITVKSDWGHGTSFCVTLPVSSSTSVLTGHTPLASQS